MDEEVKDRLMGYLTNLENAVKTGTEFTQEQAPLLVKELINWKLFEHGFYASLFLIPILILFAIAFRVYRWTYTAEFKGQKGDDQCFNIGIGIITPLIASGILFIGVAVNTFQYAKVCIAPRIVLIQEVQKIAKGL